MADSPETTVDIISIAVIAIVVGFIVYEISQASQAVSDSAGGWGSTILAGAGGIVVALLFL
jgi:hypothetical protein